MGFLGFFLRATIGASLDLAIWYGFFLSLLEISVSSCIVILYFYRQRRYHALRAKYQLEDALVVTVLNHLEFKKLGKLLVT